MAKFKWKVEEASTGPYRSFFHRGWPSMTVDGKMAIKLVCEDTYTPGRARGELKHGRIKVTFADHRAASNPNGGAFTWRRLKADWATLAEAKKAAEDFINTYPEVLEK